MSKEQSGLRMSAFTDEILGRKNSDSLESFSYRTKIWQKKQKNSLLLRKSVVIYLCCRKQQMR